MQGYKDDMNADEFCSVGLCFAAVSENQSKGRDRIGGNVWGEVGGGGSPDVQGGECRERRERHRHRRRSIAP